MGGQAAAVFLDRAKTISDEPLDFADLDVLLTDVDQDVDTTRFPNLIVAHASMFGRQGEYASLVGGEIQALALSGLLSMIGERGAEPLRLGGSQAEFSTGLAMFSGVMLALYRRSATGASSTVDVSAVRSGAYLDWKSQIYHVAEGKILQRGSESGPLVLVCADGFVGFYYRDEEWPAVKRLVGDPRLDGDEFVTQVGRDRNRARLTEIMNAWAASRSRAEIYRHSQALHIPAGSVLNLDELAEDPQVKAREFLATEHVPGLGPVSYPIAPWTINGARTEHA